MIKRRIVMGLLALGTVGGFAAGFASMSCHARARRERWEDHVAEVCVKAAKNADAQTADGRGDKDDFADREEHHGFWGMHRRHEGGWR